MVSFIRTGQHFLITTRTKNGTKVFSVLLAGFGRSLVKQHGTLGPEVGR